MSRPRRSFYLKSAPRGTELNVKHTAPRESSVELDSLIAEPCLLVHTSRLACGLITRGPVLRRSPPNDLRVYILSHSSYAV
jgi:hypothetical protein